MSYPGPDGAVVQAQGPSGYLEPVLLRGIGPNAAEIIGLFGVPDLNDDGTPEVLLDGFGNTARSLVVLEWDGCNIVAAMADDTTGEVFRLLVGIGGGSCAPVGCAVRVRCVDDQLETAVLGPRAQLADAGSGDDGEIYIETTRYRLTNGFMDRLGGDTSFYDDIAAVPDDAPTPESSDQVDC